MFDLDHAIGQWRAAMRRRGTLTDGDLAELEGHLRDKFDDLAGRGMKPAAAFQAAAAEFARADELEDDYFRARATVPGRRPPWRPPRFMPAMVWNWIKVTARLYRRHKMHHLINIGGLTVGLAFFMLIGRYIQFELGFDRFHERSDRICRVEQILTHGSNTEKTAGCPTPLREALKADFPEFAGVTRFIGASLLLTRPDGTKILADDVFAVDPDFLAMFSFPVRQGDARTALNEPYSIVITESFARQLFGEVPALGRVLRADNRFDVTVTGIVADVPPDSHIQFSVLLSAATFTALFGPDTFTRWNDNWVPLYVLLAPGVTRPAAESRIRHCLTRYKNPESRNELYLRCLRDIHLHAEVSFERGLIGSFNNILIFGTIAVFVLIIACINYVNLATARATDRWREIGLRKVVGASRRMLVAQFLGESVAAFLAALALAFLLANALLPEFNRIVNRPLALGLEGVWSFALGLAALTVVAGGLAGIYPALVLSSFRPAQVLRHTRAPGGRGEMFRRLLVVFQFFISITLIIGMFIVREQHAYLLEKYLGYRSDHVAVIYVNAASEKMRTFQQELRRHPGVQSVGASDYLVHSSTNWTHVSWEGAAPDEFMKMNVNYVDEGFIPTYQMKIIRGRPFSGSMRSWGENAVIINESAARKIGWKDPLGKRIVYDIDYRSRSVGGARVVGVVQDYHFQNLHNPIGPIMLRLVPRDQSAGILSVKISGENVAQTLAFIEHRYKEMFPEQTFSSRFLDEDFQQMYVEEQKAGQVVLYLTAIALFIACLGLFGLSSYTIRQKTREIGIRRAIGASVGGVTLFLVRRFLGLVAVANLLAWPLAYWATHRWLLNFPYRISVNWPVFALAGTISLGVAAAAVSLKAVRAACAPPADSLRYE